MIQKTENTRIDLPLVLSTLTQTHQFAVISVSQNLVFYFKKHCGNVKVNCCDHYFCWHVIVVVIIRNSILNNTVQRERGGAGGRREEKRQIGRDKNGSNKTR